MQTLTKGCHQYQTVLQALEANSGVGNLHLMAGFHGEEGVLSRDELLSRGRSLSAKFREMRVEVGDRVLTLLPTGKPFLISLVATWYAGGVIVPVACPTSDTSDELFSRKLSSILRTAKPRLIITSSSANDVLSGLLELLPGVRVLRDDEVMGCSNRDVEPVYKPVPNDVAHIQFTSGSTSFPKGAVIRHRHLVANLAGIGSQVLPVLDDSVVTWLPIHHDMGFIGGLLFPFYYGLDLHIIPTETFIRNPAVWLRAISKFRGTLSPAPTFAYDLLAARVSDQRLKGIDLSTWRYAWVGAEPIFHETLQAFHTRFTPYGLPATTLKPCYGLTESTLAVTLTQHNDGHKAEWIDQSALREQGTALTRPQDSAGAVPIVCVGTPIEGTEVRIVDEANQPIGERRQGRIQVRGTSVMSGYMGDAESPFLGEWLDTGDLGFTVDRDVYITGRAKDLIIRGGVNIHPHELERVAERISEVRMGRTAAFSYVDHGKGRENIVLVIETRQQTPQAHAQIAEEVRLRVAAEAGVQVSEVKVVPPGTVPKTTSGKTQRALCRDMFLKGNLRQSAWCLRS